MVEVFNQPQSDVPVGEIHGGIKIGQTFKADYDNLRAIKVLLATYNRENQGAFIFHLRKGLESEDNVYVYRGNMEKVQDNAFFRFAIPRIRDYQGNEILLLKGESLYFYLEAPWTEPGNAITIWSSTGDSYKGGAKIINGVPSQGDLVFKTEYERRWRLSFATLAANIRNILKFFLNLFVNPVFYFILFLTLLVCLFITLITRFGIFHRKGGRFLVLGILFFVLCLWIILLFAKKIVVYDQFDNTSTVGEIYGPKKVGQTFTAQHDHLVAIDVLMGTYQRKNTGELVFHFQEQGRAQEENGAKVQEREPVKQSKQYDSRVNISCASAPANNENEMATLQTVARHDSMHFQSNSSSRLRHPRPMKTGYFQANMKEIEDNRYHRFKIPKIRNSRGQKYYFFIEAPNASPGSAVTIWCNDAVDTYREGAKILNGEEADGDLTFRTVYDVGLRNKISLFLNEITRSKPSPLNKKSFYVGMSLLFVLSGSLFLTYVIKVFVESAEGEKGGTSHKIPEK